MRTPRPAWIEVDLAAVRHNVRVIQEHIGPHCGILAVVKANAYGHGLLEVARTVLEAGVAGLAVALVDEGVALRTAGIDAPILVLGTPLAKEADAYIAYNLMASCGDVFTARALSDAAQRCGSVARIHLKVDSGMRRCGVLAEEACDTLQQILALPSVSVEAIYTHYASADEPDLRFARHQTEVFRKCLAKMAAEAARPWPAHAANSAAIVRLPESHYDWVRPGILLYGVPPCPGAQECVAVRPALSLKALVVAVKTLRAGDAVGYGLTYRMQRPGRLALVPLGYADGFSRHNSNAGDVLVRGQRAPIRGRVCMDQFLVEVTDIPGVHIGDEVVVLGTQGSERIDAAEIAARTGSIEHEVLATLSPRLPRLYIGSVSSAESTDESAPFPV